MPPPPPRRRSRRTAAAVLGGFAVLALAGGAAVFAVSGDDDSRAGDERTQSDDDRTQSHESDDDATATARAKAAQRRETQTASASTPEPARTSGLSQILPKTPEPTATSAPVATPTRAAVAPTSVVVQQPAATATPLQPTATPTVAPEPAFPTLVNFALCHSAPGCPGGVEDLYAGFPIYVVFQLSPPTLLSVEMDVYFDEVFEYTSPFSGSSSGAYVDTVPYAEHPGYLELEIYAGDEWVDTIWADVD